jgi:hypothetical protein
METETDMAEKITTSSHPRRTRRTPLYARIIAAVLGVVLVAVLGFIIWAETPLGPAPDAIAALESGNSVTVARTAAGWEFAPDADGQVGIVFYPGGRVDARSYAPLARALAEQGYLVVITPVTLNLAVMSPNVGDRARDAHAAARPGEYAALVFLAAYPPDGTDLREAVGKVASVYGDRDPGLKMENVNSTKSLLPTDSVFTQIKGANHAQWGSYGPQPGDMSATIGPAEQLSYAIDAVRDVLGPAK